MRATLALNGLTMAELQILIDSNLEDTDCILTYYKKFMKRVKAEGVKGTLMRKFFSLNSKESKLVINIKIRL